MPLETAFVSAYDASSISTLKDTFGFTDPSELQQLANRLSYGMADNDDLEIWQANVSGIAHAPRDEKRLTSSSIPPIYSRTNSNNAVTSTLSSPRVGVSDRTRSSSNTSSPPIAASEQHEMPRTPPAKKKNRFSQFFALKEPSTMAFEELQRAAQAETRQRTAGGGSVVRATPSGKMPGNVPKVNSKWDGLPEGMRPPKTANSPYDALSAIGGVIAGKPSTSLSRTDFNKNPTVAGTSQDSVSTSLSSPTDEEFHFPPHPSVVVPKKETASVAENPASTAAARSPNEPPEPHPTSTPARSNPVSQSGLVTMAKARQDTAPWESLETPISPVKRGSEKAASTTIRPILKASGKSREDVAPWDFQEPPPHLSSEVLPIRSKDGKAKNKKSGLFGRK